MQYSKLQKTVLHKGVRLLPFIIFIFFISWNNADAAILTKPPNNLGLVGYWNFDEGTSTYAGDSSANSNIGTLTNMANPPTASSGWGNGKYGRGLNFDGTDDYVNTSDQSYFSPANNDVTVSFWVLISTNATPGDDNVCGASGDYLIAKGTTGQWEWGFENDGNDRFCMTLWQSAGTNHASIGVLRTMNDGKWHHYVGVMDYLSQYTIYVDGNSVGTTGAYSGTMTNGTQPVEVGRRGTGDNAQSTTDDVRIYNRALTASEVSALYKSGGARFSASSATLGQGTTLANGLVGHWTFDGKDTTNTTATDVSGQSNTGTFTNFTRATNAKAGKLGQGMNFDGVNDYVTLPSATMGVMATGSVSVLIKTPPTFPGGQRFAFGSDTARVYVGYNNGSLYVSRAGAQDFAPFSLSVNTWYHLVMRWGHTAGVAEAFVNGVSVGSASGLDFSSAIGSENIGSYNSGTSGFYLGTIDDVRIYNRALSSSEIKQLYNLGAAKAQASSVVLQQGTTLTNGIVGHWTFDGKDTTNTTATDMSGQGNTGTFTGFTRATNAKAGKLGQGMNFDGVDDYMNIGDIFYSDIFSVCAWVKANIVDANLRSMVTKRNSSGISSGANEWSLHFSSSEFIFSSWVSSSITSLAVTSATIPVVNTWYHVCGVQNGNGNTGYIYVNGAQDGSAIQTAVMNNLTGPVQVGVRTANNNNRYLNGPIDDVRIYNRALTASEVNQLYLMGR